MSYMLLVLGAVVLAGTRLAGAADFHRDYLNREHTRAVQGIFTLLVLMSHYKNDYLVRGAADQAYLAFARHMGQCVVVMFFFCSGYGLMKGLREKGRAYGLAIPARFLRLLGRMTLAVALFAIVQALRGHTYTLSRYLLSCIGWEGIGNSNWFIFNTLVMYLLLFLCFALPEKVPEWFKLVLFTLGCALMVRLIRFSGREAYWYNTAMTFPLGAWYCLCKEKTDRLVMRSDGTYFLTLAAVAAAYTLASLHRDDSLFIYILWTCCFALLCVLIMMKVRFTGSLITYAGSHVFSIYMLQRIPMLLISDTGLTRSAAYAAFIMVLCSTLVIAWGFDCLTAYLGKGISRLRNK